MEIGVVRGIRGDDTNIFTFLQVAVREHSEVVSRYVFCSTIAAGNFNSGVSPKSDIIFLIHHLIHRLIMFSIHYRKQGYKVMKLNLFVLMDNFGTRGMLQHTLLSGEVFG